MALPPCRASSRTDAAAAGRRDSGRLEGSAGGPATARPGGGGNGRRAIRCLSPTSGAPVSSRENGPSRNWRSWRALRRDELARVPITEHPHFCSAARASPVRLRVCARSVTDLCCGTLPQRGPNDYTRRGARALQDRSGGVHRGLRGMESPPSPRNARVPRGSRAQLPAHEDDHRRHALCLQDGVALAVPRDAIPGRRQAWPGLDPRAAPPVRRIGAPAT